MVMFLMALSLSGFGVALMCIAFAAATRDERPPIEEKPPKVLAAQIAPPSRPARLAESISHGRCPRGTDSSTVFTAGWTSRG